MKTENAAHYIVRRLNSFTLIGVFIILAAVVAVPFYTARSSSLPARHNSQTAANSGEPARKDRTASSAASGPAILAPWSSIFKPFLPAPQPFAEGIATFNSDCITPQSDFFLGDVVCAKASGVPVTLFPWHVLWIDTAGFVRQSNDASTDDTTTYLYQLPATATSDVNGQTVDNRGTWKVNLTRSNGAVRQTAAFVVHEAANPVADVFVQKFARGASARARARCRHDGRDARRVRAPDRRRGTSGRPTVGARAADRVVVGDGPANDCTIAALTNGDRAEFTAIYNTGSAAPGDYQTSATVSTTTTDPNADNNTYSAPYSVTPSNGNATCQLICPDNINAPANTTEGGQRGAHVTYDDPVTSGDCGVVTSTPASGSTRLRPRRRM